MPNKSTYLLISKIINIYIETCPNKKDIIFLMGEFNANVGSNPEGFEENGEILLKWCGNFKLQVESTLFAHKTCRA